MNIRRGIFPILAAVTIVLAILLFVQTNYAAEAKPYDWDALETLIQFGSYIAFIWIACSAGIWINAGFRSSTRNQDERSAKRKRRSWHRQRPAPVGGTDIGAAALHSAGE
jgi:hypothetical protein